MHAPFALSLMPKVACLLKYLVSSTSMPEVVGMVAMPNLPAY